MFAKDFTKDFLIRSESMREILFKAKRIDNGEWVFGSYRELPDCPVLTHIVGAPMNNPDDVNKSFFVNPETVCQYIGLTDRNGTKIFENDIVKYDDALHKVVFENRFGNAYFGIVMNDRNEVWNFSPLVPADKMFVVGNIFDNPELIRGVEE